MALRFFAWHLLLCSSVGRVQPARWAMYGKQRLPLAARGPRRVAVVYRAIRISRQALSWVNSICSTSG